MTLPNTIKNNMKELILITGASSGIGYAMANKLAEKKYDLVLVARSEDKLSAQAKILTENYGVMVHVLVFDLSDLTHAQQLFDTVKARGLRVTMLVNNAGVGVYGNFTQTSLEQELAMIRLNVESLFILTKLFAREMVSAGRGRIMNVASLLSFLPFPYYSVYSATKSFVLAFSETVAAELEGTGVIVTTLCPGPVDTAFNTKEMWRTNAYKANKPLPAETVADKAVKFLLKGKGKLIVGFNNWFIANLPRITPGSIMMRIKKQLASQRAA